MGRTAEGLQQRSNWNWRAIVIWLVIAAVVLVGGYYLVTKVFGCGQEKAPVELATVTMTSPTDSTVQQLYELRFQISDSKVAKKLKIVVKSPEKEVKGDKEVAVSEIIWRPKGTITEPGFYTVSVSGKGIQDGAFYFSIEKKEEQKVNPPPPPANPTPGTTPQSERSKTLDELANKYPVQP